ncbi:hypothetical protein OHA72_23930 [Dactylosporangium sp. NBC_01737]|uniref:hypothetical protein n=1 Tax=Dactylosporangium sp. NBC_01737 TaxID=2975959 RepID=UPI002E157D4F|nr:hypothetical protein OHA72_23930 [Dactylosporangium sp. NBC_01737]
MIRLAIGTLRRHRGAYAGTFLAALLAVALLSGGGLLLASVLTAQPPADRFAAADVVVSGERAVTVETVTHKRKKDKDKTKRKVKTERLAGAGTLPADLAARLAGLPGVASAVPDLAFPVEATAAGRPLRGADGAPVVGHGWASAVLTPYTLRTGNAPGPGEAVLDADLAIRAGLGVGGEVTVTSRTGVRTLRVAGIAAPTGRDALAAQGRCSSPTPRPPRCPAWTGRRRSASSPLPAPPMCAPPSSGPSTARCRPVAPPAGAPSSARSRS